MKAKSFDARVWGLCAQIPKGKVASYKSIAIALGNPKAARAVGNALNRNPFAPEVPCHRVVGSCGRVGGYAERVKKKIALLKREGVHLHKGNISMGFFYAFR